MTATAGAGPRDVIAAVPWRSRTVAIVLASTLLAPLGVPLISPALPVLRDVFGVDDAAASLLVSAYFVTGIFLSPFVGLLADRVGRRRVLGASLLGFAVAGVAPLALPAVAGAPSPGTYPALVGLRVLQGTAAAGIFVTTVTIVGDAFEGPRRNAVLGVNVSVLSLGAALFPVVGGALVGLYWAAPFALYGAALPVGLLALWLLPASTDARESDPDDGASGVDYLRAALAAVTHRTAIVPYTAAFLTELLLFGAVLTTLPFVLAGAYALSPVQIGLLLTAAELVAALVASQNGRLARRLSNGAIVASGFLAIGLGLLLLGSVPALVAVTIAVLVVGAGIGLSMPAVDAAISDLAPTAVRGGALSLRNSVTFLGRATGPALFAGAQAYVGFYTLALVAGVVALAMGAAAGADAGVGRRQLRSSPRG